MLWLCAASAAQAQQAVDPAGDGTASGTWPAAGATADEAFAGPREAEAIAIPPAAVGGGVREPTLFLGGWSAVVGADLAAEDPAEDVLVLRNRLDLDLRHSPSDNLRVRLAGRLNHRVQAGHRPGSWAPSWTLDLPDLGMRYDTVAELREASLQWTHGESVWTVGRDTLSWGALELQSPLRIINPVDFSLGLASALSNPDDPPLLPTWLVRLQRPLGPGQLDLVLLPFLDQHRFSPFATDTAMVQPGVGPDLPASLASMLRRADLRLDRSLSESLMLALRPPSATPLDGSLAARWSMRLDGWDLAAVALWTWDRLPALHLDRELLTVLGAVAGAGFDATQLGQALSDPQVAAALSASQGKQLTDLVRATWHRRGVVGLELQGEPVAGWLVRADVAWSHQKVLMDAQFKPLRSALWQAGAGIEHGLGDWLTALAEVTWTWAYQVPRGTALLLTARHQVQVAAGLQARWGEAQTWSAQLGGFYGVSLGDWAVAPRLTWEFLPDWRTAVGAVIADGPRTSPGGLFGSDDQVLVELRRVF